MCCLHVLASVVIFKVQADILGCSKHIGMLLLSLQAFVGKCKTDGVAMQITSKTSDEEERQAALSQIKHWCDPEGFYRKELVKLMTSPV